MYQVEDLTINATIAGTCKVEPEEFTDLGPQWAGCSPFCPSWKSQGPIQKNHPKPGSAWTLALTPTGLA